MAADVAEFKGTLIRVTFCIFRWASRHYFVSQCFIGGASEGEIREWVGHSSSRIVERYRHLADDVAQRVTAADTLRTQWESHH